MRIQLFSFYSNLEIQPLNSCKDTLSNCPSQADYCFKGYTFSGEVKVEDACPFTCKKCTRTALSCSTSSLLCLNGAACNDVTPIPKYPFGFTCICTQGYSGQFCQTVNPCLVNGGPCKNNGLCVRIGK